MSKYFKIHEILVILVLCTGDTMSHNPSYSTPFNLTRPGGQTNRSAIGACRMRTLLICNALKSFLVAQTADRFHTDRSNIMTSTQKNGGGGGG